MTRWFLLPIALGLVVVFARLWRQFRHEGPARAQARAAALAALVARLAGARVVIEPSGLPRLTGRHRGRAFEIRLIEDRLTFRKLPALWLQLTLTEPQPMTGEMRILARASGQEPFTTFADLPLALTPPPGFPDHCSIRASTAAALPGPGVMQALAQGFADPLWKEAVLGEKGLRLVVLAEEAERTPYLIYRESGLGQRPVDPDRALALMDRLIALSEHLDG